MRRPSGIRGWSRHHRPTVIVLVALLLTLGVAPPLAAPARAAAPQAPQPAVPVLTWRHCGGGFQCATAQVPLDYDAPMGRLISLALIRLPATDPAKRIGSLFTNPGGPGGSGVDFIRGAGRLFYPPAVQARFDIVGFDPRGIGASTPVQCFASAAEQGQFFAGIPLLPITTTEFDRAVALSRELAQRCGARAGDLLPHLSTANVARDLDLLRQAVGDTGLSYAGYSYGTYLGATYANLFPRKVRALVLDGLVDAPAYTGGPQPSAPFVRQHSAEGSAQTLGEFFRLCAEAGSRCAFTAGGAPRAKYAQLAQRLRQAPLTDPSGAKFGYAELVFTTVQALYGPHFWGELASLLQQLYTLTQPVAAARRLTELARSASPAPYPNDREAQLGSTCGETANPRDPAVYPRLARDADRRWPYVGSVFTYITLPCTFWPATDADRFAGPWRARTATPPLLLNPRVDPATPYRNAHRMEDLLVGSRLVTVEGWGHTALLTRSACADGHVERYLIEQRLPARGARCLTGVVPFAPTLSAARNAVPQTVVPAGPVP